MSSNNEVGGASPNEMAPATLYNQVFYEYLVATAIIPFVFMGIDFGEANVIPPEFASAMVRELSFVWPTLPPQYDAISTVRGANHAANYALFFLVLLASILISIVYTARRYRRERRHIKVTDERDLLAMVAFLVGALYALLLDQVEESPRPIFNFIVDDFGLYFIRQYTLFLGLWGTVIAVFILIMRSIDNSNGDGPEESSRTATKEH